MELARYLVTLVFAASGLSSCRDQGSQDKNNGAGAQEEPSTQDLSNSDRLGESPAAALEGNVSLIGGSTHDLSQNRSRPTVLFFVADTCQTCAKETAAIRDELAKRQIEPASVDLMSIVVGATEDDASDWKEAHQVPWTVGFQTPEENASLLRRYCPRVQVPCTFVYNPATGTKVARVGEVTTAELETLTGEWK